MKIETEKNQPVLLEAHTRVFSEVNPPAQRITLFTPHRFAVLTLVALLFGGLYILYQTIWPAGWEARSYLELAWSTGHLLWVAGVPACLLGLIGLVLYRRKPLVDVGVVPNQVVWRIVSYGDNVSALTQSVDVIVRHMKEYPLFPYTIEVVVEEGTPFCDVTLTHSQAILQIVVVPATYQTPNKTSFKARALHYALEKSTAPDDAWIIHLDEESRPTESFVLGVAMMIAEEEASGAHRIGQGVILYHRFWEQKRNFFWTLLETARTGQDIGPFYLQCKLGVSLYGFHGSYIVVRNSVEKSIPGGFDLGPEGSITEDAWWILIANKHGHKIRWVEGYLEEQSAQSFKDFMKQRGRWFYGLRKVVKHAPVSWWRRLPLRLNLLLWMLVWLSVPYSLVHLLYGFEANSWLLAFSGVSLTAYAAMVVVGLWVNLQASKRFGWVWYIVLTPLQILLVPVYILMEMGAALLRGVIWPQKGFHVIKK